MFGRQLEVPRAAGGAAWVRMGVAVFWGVFALPLLRAFLSLPTPNGTQPGVPTSQESTKQPQPPHNFILKNFGNKGEGFSSFVCLFNLIILKSLGQQK